MRLTQSDCASVVFFDGVIAPRLLLRVRGDSRPSDENEVVMLRVLGIVDGVGGRVEVGSWILSQS